MTSWTRTSWPSALAAGAAWWDVPDDLHATIRGRAAHSGQSVSDYLLELLRELMARPTMAEIVQRAEALARADEGATRADIRAEIRAGRDR